MRFNSVGFALSVGMALIVVLIGFTLLSAAGLAGFAADDLLAESQLANDTTSVGCRGIMPMSPTVKLADLPAGEAAKVAAGDALFKGNCAQCHAVNEQVVGPALAGITKRRPVSWILPWVKNSSKVVASGDDYAVALFNKFNQQQMPSFDLSDKEIAAILSYVSWQQGENVAVSGAIASCE